jgi:glycosyltransferase involved in cell wall biosynthesis
MKTIVVCSYKKNAVQTNGMAPFIWEQVAELQQLGCQFRFVFAKNGGLKGYFSAYKNLLKEIKNFQPQIIHAHGGLCGLIANFQRNTRVITTFHGSDINIKFTRFFSKIAIKFSKFNIFVSQKLINIAKPKKNFALLPCGVDIQCFTPLNKIECRQKFNFDLKKNYILFSNAFNINVKNAPLAIAAVKEIPDAELIELKGFTRQEVNLLLNACDVALMTSFSEGSPQFIKEALAANCPIISTDVGDAKQILENVNNCYITSYKVNDVVEKIKLCLKNNEKTNGRKILMQLNLDNKTVAEKVLKIYRSIM